MIRRAFTVAAALSLLLCIATVVLWVRSYWAADSVWWNGFNRVHAIVLSRGKLGLFFQQINASAPFSVTANRGHRWNQVPSDMHANGREGLGFGYATLRDAYGSRQTALVPCWFFAICAGTLAAVLLWGRRRMRVWLRRQNRCERCGYDLRATPDRCPECGTPE